MAFRSFASFTLVESLRGTLIFPPMGLFFFFISSTNFLKLKFLKSGAGVPSIPTGSGTCSTSVPTPLLDKPTFPKNDVGFVVVLVVEVAVFLLLNSQGLNP